MDSIKCCYISLDRHMSLYTYVISIKDSNIYKIYLLDYGKGKNDVTNHRKEFFFKSLNAKSSTESCR